MSEDENTRKKHLWKDLKKQRDKYILKEGSNKGPKARAMFHSLDNALNDMRSTDNNLGEITQSVPRLTNKELKMESIKKTE